MWNCQRTGIIDALIWAELVNLQLPIQASINRLHKDYNVASVGGFHGG